MLEINILYLSTGHFDPSLDSWMKADCLVLLVVSTDSTTGKKGVSKIGKKGRFDKLNDLFDGLILNKRHG